MMRTYERREGNNREAIIERLGRSDYSVTLTRHGRSVTETRRVRAHSLKEARDFSRDFIAGRLRPSKGGQ
jgi:hypothetical protein